MIAPPPTEPPRRLAYLGSPPLAVAPLRALVDAGFEVGVVVSQPDKRRGRGGALQPSPVKAAALELGLPVTDRVVDVIDAGVDLGVVVAFGRIIPVSVLEHVPMVNLHFSLLPRWRGAAPVERAILAGDERTGVDLMVVEEGLDTGGLFAATEVAIGSDESLEELRAQLVAAGIDLLLDGLRSGLGEPTPQAGDATYATKIEPAERELDWGAPATDVHRRVRVGDAWTTHHGRRLKVHRTHVPPQGDGPVVAAGDGPVELVEVQPEGKPPRRRRRLGSRRPLAARRPAALMTALTRSRPSARTLALEALDRIDPGGAYANLLLPELLTRSGLSERDRHFTTELVYGTTRMRRACDLLVDRFLTRTIDPTVRNALRLGAYQLHHMSLPAHAAVGETVGIAPRPARGLVNAVLRRVADNPVVWPDEATRLQLSGLGGRPARCRPGRGRCGCRARDDEPGADRHHRRRRVRAGPRVALGRRGGGSTGGGARARSLRGAGRQGAGAGRVGSGRRCWRCPRRSGGVGRRQRARIALGCRWSWPTAPRPVRAQVVRPRAGGRTVLGPGGAAPPARRRAGGWTPTRSIGWRSCSARSWTRPLRCCDPEACSCTRSARSPMPRARPSTPTSLQRTRSSRQRRCLARRGAPPAAACGSCPRMPTPTACTSSASVPPGNGQTAGVALRAKVITVSDGVADGSREDTSGAALVERLTAAGFDVDGPMVVGDGVDSVADALREACDDFAGLVVTTGGTGFGPRDLTPEGTRAVLDREAPGLAEAMRLVSPLGPPVAGRGGDTGGWPWSSTPPAPPRAASRRSRRCSTSSPMPSTSWRGAGRTEDVRIGPGQD